MKHVGILTYQNTLNYGAILQCYALYEVLRSLDTNPEVIDYRCKAVDQSECQSFSMSSPVSILKYLMKTPIRQQFSKFKRHMTFSSTCDFRTIVDVARAYDCIVVGSDQVWNPAQNGFDNNYFLDFEKEPEKCLSYAASMGGAHLAQQPYSAFLDRFSSILVREQSAADEMEHLLPLRSDVRVVLDPTLLVTKEQWQSIARVPSYAQEHEYVLLYAISESTESCRIATSLSRQLNCKIIQICPRRKGRMPGALHFTRVSPSEFVGLFANARATVVSSYHGVCFSIVFNRSFYCTTQAEGKGASRFSGFLDALGVDNRVLRSAKEFTSFAPLDNELLHPTLSAMRLSSIDALAASLNL